MARPFVIPFASAGDKDVTPDAVQPTGSVSYSEGFTLDYELLNTDPDYKPVPRQGTNGLFFDVTNALSEIQKLGKAIWYAAHAPYAINAEVRHNNINWRSTVTTNNSTPGANSDWLDTSASAIFTNGIGGAYSNLRVSASGTNASVAATADQLTVRNPTTGAIARLASVSISASLAVSGLNGLDTGVSAASSWYYLYVIWNGSTVAGLLSLNATAPTVLPSGYTHYARISSVRSDAVALNKFPLSFLQRGNRIQYAVVAGSNVLGFPQMSSGSIGAGTPGSPVYAAVTTGQFVPPTAISINALLVALNLLSGQQMSLTSNALGAGGDFRANPPAAHFFNNGASAASVVLEADMMLESGNIYGWVNASTVSINCMGWRENI